MIKPHEIPYTQANFNELQQLANEHIGLALTDHKYSMVYNRLVKRVRDELGLASFAEYIHLLKTKPEQEMAAFINSITTNVTFFFRENHHFIFLKQVELPRILRDKSGKNKIRIWSAGCSTGEEPYSIAIAAQEVLTENSTLEIIATDIDSQVLSLANKAIYPKAQVEKIDIKRLKFAFLQGTGKNADLVKVKPFIKKHVRFMRHNLLESRNHPEKVEIIFCRNVLIYFDQEKKRAIVENFADSLTSDGILILGHSESLYGVNDRFKHIDTTIYRKVK